jgi:hypothetical protein
MIDFLSKPAVQWLLALGLSIVLFFILRQLDPRFALVLGISTLLIRRSQSKNLAFILIIVGTLSFIEGFRHSSLWLFLAPLTVATAWLVLEAPRIARERQSSDNAPPPSG